MKTIELFAGTRSFSLVAKRLGHETFTTDYEEIDGQHLVADVRTLTFKDFPYVPDMLWASPPCEGFSVAAIGRNWTHDHQPKTDSARLAMELALNAIRLIDELNPKYWFIENPRGKLRKMPFMEEFLKRQGGYGTLYGTVATETSARNQPTYGQMRFGGYHVPSARMVILTMKLHQGEHVPAHRASRGTRIDPAYRNNYSRRYLAKPSSLSLGRTRSLLINVYEYEKSSHHHS